MREHFRRAGRPFLGSPWSWLSWSVLLPLISLATPLAFRVGGPPGVLFAWSGAILLGGAVEMLAIFRSGKGLGMVGTPLSSFVLSIQGNLSLAALILSALFVWQDLTWALPGLWLLLLGHSFYLLGGLAFGPLRTCGLIYQLGGLAALWPDGLPLLALALATGLGNLWMAISIWRER